MKTKTELQIDYVYLSWKYDFPPKIEAALENDYVASPHLYDEGALKRVATLLLIEPDASPECVMGTARGFQPDSQVTAKQLT